MPLYEHYAATPRAKMMAELGWEVRRVGEELHGSAVVVPEMCAPGTDHLRTSILALWVDILVGLQAVDVTRPRVPVTVELDVHLTVPAPGSGRVLGMAKIVKAGRAVIVADTRFTTGEGDPIAFGGATFMATPDDRAEIDWGHSLEEATPAGGPLAVPFAKRVGCERTAPGVATLPSSEEVLNAAKTINGGLIALAAEEAALSLTPGATLSSLALRYLQPARIGPVVATATAFRGLGQVEVRDAGNDSRLCMTATCRWFP